MGAIAIASVLAVRPDPRALAVAEVGVASAASRPARTIVRLPVVTAAIAAAAVGQVAMVGVMSVTPIALHDHGHGPALISGTISLHVIGMFAFSPLIGAALDRWGRRPGLLVGAVVSAVGAVTAGVTTSGAVVALGLWLVGLGWSATYLGSTAVISDATSPAERAGTLGLTDLVISACSAIGAIGAGVVFEGAGFAVLGASVAILVLAVVVGVVVRAPVPDRPRSLAPPPVP
jgi:MFS family permease